MSFRVSHSSKSSFFNEVHGYSDSLAQQVSLPQGRNSARRSSISSSSEFELEENNNLIDLLKNLVTSILEKISWLLSWFPLLDKISEWLEDDTPRNLEVIHIEDMNSDS